MTPCDVAALKKCLEEHKGDGDKCKEHIAAFKTACSVSSSGVSSSSPQEVQSGLTIQGASSRSQGSRRLEI